LKSKFFAQFLAFLLIITPMILIQVNKDREISDSALVQRDSNLCFDIQRLIYKKQCLEKIADRKESYCQLLPASGRSTCIEKEAVTLRNKANQISDLYSFLLILLELIPLILITLWSMGLTPIKYLRSLPRIIQEISTAETFTFLRLPIAGVSVLIYYFIFRLF
tara:strand:+ start:443 stop:934 length:492 start_codon:yes stop_codon:yes gene_type:complete